MGFYEGAASDFFFPPLSLFTFPTPSICSFLFVYLFSKLLCVTAPAVLELTVDQEDLRLTEILLPLPQVLGLKACTNT